MIDDKEEKDMETKFRTRDGEVKIGMMVRSYRGFEDGNMRYIINSGGMDYRCVKDADGEYVEFVP